MGEKIFLGTITLDDSAPTKLVLPALDLSAPVEQLQAAIAEAEAKHAAERVAETKRLREMFALPDATKAEDEPPAKKPIYCDWLFVDGRDE
jgi:hypothetical protein